MKHVHTTECCRVEPELMARSPERPNYTGCDCHDACNEAWLVAHMGYTPPESHETTADDYQEVNGKWVRR